MSELTTTQTDTSVAGNEAQAQSTTPVIDWSTLDFSQAPEDVLAKVPLDKHPGARKMQGSLRKQTAQVEAKYKADLALAQEQITKLTELISGQMPESTSQVTAIQERARMRQLEAIVQETEAEKVRRQAIEKMAETYEVDPTLLEDAGDGYEAYERVISAKTLQFAAMKQQMDAMQKRLEALSRASTDPAANVDTTTGRPGNNYQEQYDALMKKFRGDEASKLRRKAEAEGVQIDLLRWRT